jgi:hypothetical protein
MLGLSSLEAVLWAVKNVDLELKSVAEAPSIYLEVIHMEVVK